LLEGQSATEPKEQLSLVIEFTHALQDQHFDLEEAQSGPTDEDRARAALALIEGDATLTSVLFASQFLDRTEALQRDDPDGGTVWANAPPAVERLVEFPYREGFFFALGLWRMAGYDVLNEAYRDPPRSTTQILHPERYLAHWQPIPVSLPDLA